MAKATKEKLYSKKINILCTVIFVTLCLLIGFTAYLAYYHNRVLPHVQLGNIQLGSQTSDGAKQKILEQKQNLPKTLTINVADQNYTIDYTNIDFDLDEYETLNNVQNYGHGQSWPQNLGEQLMVPFYSPKINWSYTFSLAKLSKEIGNISTQITNAATQPSIQVKNNNFIVVDGTSGKMVNRQRLITQIEESWKRGQFDKIHYAPEDFSTDQKNQEYRTLVDDLNSYNVSLQLSAADKSKKITTEMLKNCLLVVRDNENNSKLIWELNKLNIQNQLQEIAEEIKTSPQNAKLTFANGIVSVTKDAVNGKKIDIDQGINLVISAITQKQTIVNLPVVTIPAEVTRENFNTLGIKEIIGTASTTFKGSSTNRIHNVANGASILNGSVVKPGEEFSTAAVMGDVSDTTGFVPELVIKGDKIVPEFGGGLCQVSTTLFRSVLNAGLKVTERQNHSYRVGYYEPPVGLDATVYFPHPDFRFINDTANYILVQSKVENIKITFELYGTKDGRVATLEGPTIISTTPAPSPKYIQTDTLFKGEVKKTESAHEGATTVAYYTVTRDGNILFKQTFKSVYKAGAAQYLVGTKEQPAPAATEPSTEPVLTG